MVLSQWVMDYMLAVKKEPNVYCVLCVLMSKGHVTTCTSDCKPPLLEVNVEEDGEEAYHGCPYLRRMKNQNKDL